MNWDDKGLGHLTGRLFDNALRVRIASPSSEILSRTDLVVRAVAGKKVIHLGCVDHLPLLDGKVEQGTWLHGRIDEHAARCLGVDIDEEGVRAVQAAGYADTICEDITSGVSATIAADQWDYLVIGEVLEHIDDPVSFLRAIKRNYGGSIGRVILTVPNAFRIKNFENAFRHLEQINSDHRYWFTPFTLSKVVVQAGLAIEGYEFCEHDDPSKRGPVHRLLLRRYPALRAGLFLTAVL